jgi:flagellar motility protein MotE (MotC chaperone)
MAAFRLDPIIRTAGVCLVGALLPVQALGAEPGWLPVVVKTGKTPGFEPDMPPLPRVRGDTSRGAAPGVNGMVDDAQQDVPAPLPAPSSVGAIPSTRMLSPSDSARLKVAKTGEVSRAGDGTGAATMPDSDLAQRYCVSIADAAADARIAWQKAKLAETEKEIGERIAALEAKTAEYKAWLERRDEFSRKATQTLVEIYAQMEPDAASLQLAVMDEETAAAILTKLDPSISGGILNEMQPDKAARLSGTIAGAARVPKRRRAALPDAAEAAGDVPRQANQGGGR